MTTFYGLKPTLLTHILCMFFTDLSPTESLHFQGQSLCPMIVVAAVPVHKVEHAFLTQLVFSACVQLSQ